MNELISLVSNFVCGPVLLILLVETGIFMTIRFRFRPWRHFFHSLGYIWKSNELQVTNGDVNSYEALSIALASTVGAGNIAGGATAIILGGPGGVF